MNNSIKFISLLLYILGIIFLSGCGSSKQSPEQARSERALTPQERELNQIRHDRALQHFIEGTALDAKGSYAEAILEYQEALQAEPNATIFFAISKDYLLLNKINRAAETAIEAVRLEPKNISYRENLGAIYFNASRADLAIREYEEIIKIDSNYTAGWFALARLYQQMQPQKALEIYENMLDRDSDQLDVLFQCAQIYTSLGQFDKAAAKYKQMLDLDPSNKPLQKQLAETFAKSGKLDQAQTLLETMVETDSSDTEVAAVLADVYLEQKQFQKAINLYEKLLNRSINNTEIKLRIGVGFFGLAEHDTTLILRSKSLFDDLQKEIPNDWRPYWYLGAIAASQRKDSLASNYFEQVTKLEEHHADAWWYLGSSLFEQGKYEKLLETMEQAQKALPKDFRFYLLQGFALIQMSKQQEAVKPLEKAYELDSKDIRAVSSLTLSLETLEQVQKLLPKDFRFYLLQGFALIRMSKQEEAVKSLTKAYELNPKDLSTISTLALTLDGLQRYQDSDPIYEEGLKQYPKSVLLLNNYSYSLSERGLQLKRSLEMSKEAITAEPDNAAYLDTYGWILFKMENYKDAAVYIEKSIAIGKASAVVHEHLGDVYQKLGQKEKAMELWKKALEMDPKNETAKEKIAGGAN